MRRLSIFLIILAFSFLLISCKETTPTSPTTTAVKPVVIRETGKGFDMIQEAIEKAEPGQHIDVAAGTYVENLVISKELYLTGENQDTTVLKSGGSTGIIVRFSAGAEGSNIRGFTIKHDPFSMPPLRVDNNNTDPTTPIKGKGITLSLYGIRSETSSVTIGRNIIDGGDIGINWYLLSPGSDGKIRGVLIKHSFMGMILINAGTELLVSEVTIEEEEEFGIYSINSSPSIAGCKIKGIDYGIHCRDNSQPDLGGGASGSPGQNIIRDNTSWDFYNQSTNPIKAENNYWSHTNAAEIDAHDICDDDEYAAYGAVDFEPFLTSPPRASLMMKPRLLYASYLFADFFRSLFRSDIPASAIHISSSFEPKLHLARFELIRAGYRSFAEERFYPPLMLRAGR